MHLKAKKSNVYDGKIKYPAKQEPCITQNRNKIDVSMMLESEIWKVSKPM